MATGPAMPFYDFTPPRRAAPEVPILDRLTAAIQAVDASRPLRAASADRW